MYSTCAISWRTMAITLFFTLFSTSTFSQTLTILHTFQGSDGIFPSSGLIRGSDGNFYGTTIGGGTSNTGSGTVFKITPSGQFTLIHSFAGGSSDGWSPMASVIRDGAGNLYGTTYYGGPSNAGVVYKITPAGRETLLYAFTGGADGGNPSSDLVRDSKGNLYGTARAGGDVTCYPTLGGCGTVFKIDTTGKETTVHTFEGQLDGATPSGGLVIDSAGNLYGTTYLDGLYGAGQIFKIDKSGNKTVVHDFHPGTHNEGGNPATDLAFAPGGILYGTTYAGGDLTTCSATGCGVVFKVNTKNVVTTVHSFEGAPSDGSVPSGPVARDAAGNLYGATANGGLYSKGVVYKLDASGNETILYAFTGGSDGWEPSGRLYVSSDGTVYGTTVSNNNGLNGDGVVFKITP